MGPGEGARIVGALRRRVTGVLLAAVLVVAGMATTPAQAVLDGSLLLGEDAIVDPLLAGAIELADPADELVAVVVVDAGILAATLEPTLGLLGLDALAYEQLPMLAVRGTPAQLLEVAALPGVDSMWLNTPLEVALAESRSMIGADVVHTRADLGYTGEGVGIAVLDSGIDGLHPDLVYPTKTVQNVKVLGNQHVFDELTLAVEDLPNTDTTTGHGTHVAAIAAGDGAASDGLYAGVAPGAHLVGVGSADGVEMLTALAGYDWILGNHEIYGIRVINNSWADGTVTYDPDHPLNRASKAAHDAGLVVVFAAGNDGQSSGNVYNRYAFPDWVIGVGGVTKLGGLGDYSSRGDATEHPDVMAPGSFIASARAITGVVTDANSSPFDLTDPMQPRMIAPEHALHYTAAIGTSMSAPHVAGVAALMLEANPALTPGQVRQILVQTASAIPGCPVIDCGAGLVNAVAAVHAAIDVINQAPVAALTTSGTSGEAPLAVTFDGSASHDPDGVVVAHEWDLDGDGTFETLGGSTQMAAYSAGRTTVALRVSDDDGARSAPITVEIRSSDAPVASATAPAQAFSGETVTIDASASHDPDGQIVEYRFSFGDGTELTTSEPRADHAWTATRSTRRVWTVTDVDDAGVADATSGTVRVVPGSP